MNYADKSQLIAPHTTIIQGRYQVLKHLHQGRFGHTCLAQDLAQTPPKCIIIKQIYPRIDDSRMWEISRRLFVNEVNSLRRLRTHPQVPQILDWFATDSGCFLVEEVVSGDLFTAQLNQIWTQQQCLDFLRDILPVLAFIHAQEIIHCDLQPMNLMLRHSDRKIIVIDFGAAQPIRHNYEPPILANNKQAKYRQVISPSGYLAPEQLLGYPQPSTDIYALGMICLQALTGMLPDQIQMILGSGRQMPIVAEPKFQQILQQMVAVDYRLRYSSVHAVCQDLAKLVNQSPMPVLPPPPEPVEELWPQEEAAPPKLAKPGLDLPILGTGVAIGLGVNGVLIAMGLYSLANPYGKGNPFDMLSRVDLPDLRQRSPKHDF